MSLALLLKQLFAKASSVRLGMGSNPGPRLNIERMVTRKSKLTVVT